MGQIHILPECARMRPRLVIEAGDAEPAVCNLQPDQVASLGRNRKNTIVLQDRHASRWHAEIVREDGRWVLRDRETLNGTLLNKQRIREPAPLSDGDEIRIGDTRMRFLIDPAEIDTAERPSLAKTLPAMPAPAL